MDTKLVIAKLSVLVILFFGYNIHAYAEMDTIPPVISGCGDTVKVQLGSVWVEPIYKITDNQSDSAHITVVKKWGAIGPVGSLGRRLYTRIIEATDSNGNKTKCNIYYKLDDFIAPVINLNTPDTICHIIGKPYNSVAPTVIDNYYPAGQVILIRGTNANFNVAGIYREVFKASDPSANVSYKTRYIVVSPDCGTASTVIPLTEPFTLYPNPVNDFLQIDLKSSGVSLKIEIISMDGKVVFESDFAGPLKIYTGNFSDGVYTVIGLGGKNVIHQKFAVQHG